MIYLQDTDFTLHHGDALTVLQAFPAESVDCVITSPPYWGLRDYGTGQWDGGNADCDHMAPGGGVKRGLGSGGVLPDGTLPERHKYAVSERVFPDTCGKCGARRVDQQLGLEPTPDLYVQRMVELFREVRRVLARHGTCWVNLGDSYAQDTLRHRRDVSETDWAKNYGHVDNRVGTTVGGLKAKDLCGIPWRVAFALQADGWYLRADIIWAKPNPMPESVTDRPTKAHEYVFLLAKQPRYWFDQEAVREPATYAGEQLGIVRGTKRRASANGRGSEASGNESPSRAYAIDALTPAGRNVRSVWEIPTQPYPDAHFATYPEELVRRCLLAGCPEWVCRTCGKPRERIMETTGEWRAQHDRIGKHDGTVYRVNPSGGVAGQNVQRERRDHGWSDCGHQNYRPGRVLDPFLGSGTTAHVARKHGRHTIGIELNEAYCKLILERTKQLSLLT